MTGSLQGEDDAQLWASSLIKTILLIPVKAASHRERSLWMVLCNQLNLKLTNDELVNVYRPVLQLLTVTLVSIRGGWTVSAAQWTCRILWHLSKRSFVWIRPSSVFYRRSVVGDALQCLLGVFPGVEMSAFWKRNLTCRPWILLPQLSPTALHQPVCYRSLKFTSLSSSLSEAITYCGTAAALRGGRLPLIKHHRTGETAVRGLDLRW